MKRYERPMTTEEMKKVTDKDIDFSDIPEADAAFWASAKVHVPDRPKLPLNVRLDADVVEWFKSQGKGYQTRINAVLRSFYEAHKEPTPPTPRRS
jgi:uncharacterized protein (DUF4415 family)